MVSFIKEIIMLVFNASSGITKIRSNPNEIIIDAEIRINHLVIGSKSILEINY